MAKRNKNPTPARLALALSVHTRLIIASSIVVFAGIGAYIVLQSKAATTARVYFDSAQASVGHAVGSNYDLTVYADMPTPPSGVMYMRVFSAVDTNHSEYLGLDCGLAGPCDSPTGDSVGQGGPDYCIKVDNSKFGSQGVKVFTLHYKSLGSGAPPLRLHADWWTGQCGVADANQKIAYDGGSNQYAKCGEQPDWVECAPGPDTGNEPTQRSTEIVSTSEIPNNGGGAGTSTNTQSNTPNTVPASSPQGDTSQQTELNPSPFYDGKQYGPGSDPIDEKLGKLTIGDKKLVHGWLYVLSLVMATILAGLSLLLWHKHRKQK
jgi:hypothetical protein